MNRKENPMEDRRSQEIGISPDGRSAVRLEKPASAATGLIAERITATLLLIICIAAAVLA
jgi:hypothetical protein